MSVGIAIKDYTTAQVASNDYFVKQNANGTTTKCSSAELGTAINGNADISSIGDGTVKGAIAGLYNNAFSSFLRRSIVRSNVTAGSDPVIDNFDISVDGYVPIAIGGIRIDSTSFFYVYSYNLGQFDSLFLRNTLYYRVRSIDGQSHTSDITFDVLYVKAVV